MVLYFKFWCCIYILLAHKNTTLYKTDFFVCVYLVFSEKAMAPHSSTLAWKIPWMEEPGRLQSMGSLRVGHDWVTSFSLSTFMHWRRKWQPIPVFLTGESQGPGSLVGCCLWGHTESDTTEVISSSSIAQTWMSYKRLPKRLLQMSCLYFLLSTSLESK